LAEPLHGRTVSAAARGKQLRAWVASAELAGLTFRRPARSTTGT
jgi:hypothetical protein